MAFPTLTTAPTARFVATTGVTSSGGDVSQWDDQTGNGNHAVQATANRKPTVTTDTFGATVIRFEMSGRAANVAEFLTFLSGTATSIRAMSFAIAFRTRHLVTGTVLGMETVATSSMRDAGAATEGVYLGGRLAANYRWKLNRTAVGFIANGATNVKGQENVQADVTLSAANNTTGTGWTLGGLSSGASGHGIDIYEAVFWNSAISDADMTAAMGYLETTYNLRTTAYTKQLVYAGDSITAGSGIPDGNGYPAQAHKSTNDDWRQINAGFSGNQISNLVTQASQYLDAYRDATYTRNVLHVLIGRNDMGAGAKTGAQFYGTSADAEAANTLCGYVKARVAAGWEVWVGTVIASTAIQTEIDSANSLIRGTPLGGTGNGIIADAGATRVVDYAALPEFDTAGDSANVTYYQGDNTHPTTAGAAKMAVLPQALIDTAAAGGGTSRNRTLMGVG